MYPESVELRFLDNNDRKFLASADLYLFLDRVRPFAKFATEPLVVRLPSTKRPIAHLFGALAPRIEEVFSGVVMFVF
jgi:hypothetical protein